jgi:hypothetical protein
MLSTTRRASAITSIFCIIVLPAPADEAAGAVKVGSSGAARAIEGAIRYADKKLQLCDGEGWRSASTASDHP